MPIGPLELILILVVVVLLFGASRIPKIARALGQGLKEFKKGLKDNDDHKEKE